MEKGTDLQRRDFLRQSLAAAGLVALSQIGCSTKEKAASVIEKPVSPEEKEIADYIEALPDSLEISTGTVTVQKFPVKGARNVLLYLPKIHRNENPFVSGSNSEKVRDWSRRTDLIGSRGLKETSSDCREAARILLEKFGIQRVGGEGMFIEQQDILQEAEKGLVEMLQEADEIRTLIADAEKAREQLPAGDPKLPALDRALATTRADLKRREDGLARTLAVFSEEDPVFSELFADHDIHYVCTERKSVFEKKEPEKKVAIKNREKASLGLLAASGKDMKDRKTAVWWGGEHWRGKEDELPESMREWNAENPNDKFALVVLTTPASQKWMEEVHKIRAEMRAYRDEIEQKMRNQSRDR